MELDLATHAQVMAELSRGGDIRADVLARHGLDEASWEAQDARWQAQLTEALADDADGATALLSAHAAAYEAAQRALATPITIEQFAEVTRILQATGDLGAALARVGTTLADYVQGSEHWSRRIVEDPEIDRRFEAAGRGPLDTG